MFLELIAQIYVEVLTVPAWQMGLYILLISIFMLARDHRLALITTYLFTLYWGYFLYFGDILDSFGSFPGTIYIFFGLLHVAFTVVAFIQEKT